MTHPLTDEICKGLAVCYPYNRMVDIEDCGHITDMRAAADWQLRKDILWWHRRLMAILPDERAFLLKEFKNAMRPQEDKQP